MTAGRKVEIRENPGKSGMVDSITMTEMASRYGSLIKEATMLLDKFSTAKQSLDDFTSSEDASKAMENLDALDKKFILDIVSGCVEYKKILDIVINVFYAQNGKGLFRRDHNPFAIICYLSIFCLDDLGLQNFSNIVKSLDIRKMEKFLRFFFSVTNLTTWIREEWSRIYDGAYVERNWIVPLLRWCPEMEILMDQLAAGMSGGSRVKRAPAKTTQPQEFSLTKPKPRSLPVPEPIQQQEKHQPVPSSTYMPPKAVQVMEEIKLINREKAEQIRHEANIKQFKCANPQKSEHTKNLISQIQDSLESKLKFNSVHSSGAPATHKTNNWPIKLNNTAILREGALYNRKVEEEQQRMDRLIGGEGEPSSFLQWQREMRERDLEEELAHVECKHLDGQISYEEAATARTRIMVLNQKTAQLKKEEMAELMKQYAKTRLQEEKEMRDLVQEVSEGHKNSKAAKRKLHEFKQRIVKEVSVQNRELLRQALEDAQAELSRRFELIREIHAMQSVQLIRHKFVDDTETAGHDLLGEMSLAELKERLAILNKAKQREQSERRERIVEDKQNKELLLLEQLDINNLHRKALAQAAACRKEDERTRLAVRQQMVTVDERVLALQKQLEEKQQERRRLRQDDRNKAEVAQEITKQHLKSCQQQKKILPVCYQKTLEEQPQDTWGELERCLASLLLRE